MKKQEILKIFKILIILFLVAVLLETAIFGYNRVINKVYEKKHLIGNQTIELNINELEISDVDEYGYVSISYNKKIQNVSNIELVTKEKNQDLYVRLQWNGKESFMPKYNKEQTIFKAYLDERSNIDGFKIVYYANQLSKDNIENIIVNDNLNYIDKKDFSILNICIFYALFIIYYGVFILYKRLKSKEKDFNRIKVFLTLGSIIGIISCFINVPLSKFDEHAHFWRAYEISNGTIISGYKSKNPQSIFDIVIDKNGTYQIEDRASYNNFFNALKIKLNSNEISERLVGATSGLSPISYVPQVIGIFIGRILKFNPLIIAIMGRITSLIFYLICISISIKMMPKEKWKDILVVVALLPMSMYIAASLSPDNVIICVMTLALSFVLKIKYGEEKVKIIDAIIFGIFVMIATLCKEVYLPIILLFLLIPIDKFKNSKQKILYFLLAVLIVFGIKFAWSRVPVMPGEIALSPNMTEQINFVLSNPIRDAFIAINTLETNTSEYYSTMIGGWNTSTILVSAFSVIIVLVTFGDNYNDKKENNIELNKIDRFVLLIINLIIITLIFGGLYVTWSRAQSMIVDGVQGRYFLPILPYLLIMIENNKIKYNFKNKNKKYFLLIILLYIPIIIGTIQYFNK